MSVEPFFSVVIPTYNRADKLRLTLESVLNQTFADFEVLVMDDGSSDSTRAAVGALKDDRIKYTWDVNSGGPATPRNRGIDASSGSWISFLDADDIWYPERLSKIARVIEENPQADVICHDEIMTFEGRDETKALRYGPFEKNFYKILLTEGNRLSTSAVTVRRFFLCEHDLKFNEARDYVIVEDYDMWLRLAEKGAKFKFIRDILGEYVIENDNISLSTDRLRNNQIVLLRDHVYEIQQFEPDKDKLWQQISSRIEMDVGRECIHNGEILNGLKLILRTTMHHPLQVFLIFLKKAKYKLSVSREA